MTNRKMNPMTKEVHHVVVVGVSVDVEASVMADLAVVEAAFVDRDLTTRAKVKKRTVSKETVHLAEEEVVEVAAVGEEDVVADVAEASVVDAAEASVTVEVVEAAVAEAAVEAIVDSAVVVAAHRQSTQVRLQSSAGTK